MQYKDKIKALEDSLARVRESNIKLQTENNMLKNQLKFMENLLMKQTATITAQNGVKQVSQKISFESTTQYTSHGFDGAGKGVGGDDQPYLHNRNAKRTGDVGGELERRDAPAGTRVSRNFQMIGLVCFVMAISVISENPGGGELGAQIGRRLLQECEFVLSGMTLFVFDHQIIEKLTIASGLRLCFVFVILYLLVDSVLVWRQERLKEERWMDLSEKKKRGWWAGWLPRSWGLGIGDLDGVLTKKLL